MEEAILTFIKCNNTVCLYPDVNLQQRLRAVNMCLPAASCPPHGVGPVNGTGQYLLNSPTCVSPKGIDGCCPSDKVQRLFVVFKDGV